MKYVKITALALASIIVAFGLALYYVPLPERLDPPVSQTVHYADGQRAHVFLAADDRWRIAASHEEVDPDYLEALIALEDKRFWSHPGVDPIAVVRAALSNVSNGSVISGASTITMQVVRMSEPRPRTLRSKVVESFRALQLELHYTKEEILDVYLSLLPYGDNYEGLETAAQVYFGHDASSLTPAQIATLLAVPQAPTSRAPSPGNEERLRLARDEIAEYLLERGALPRGMASERLTDEQAMEAIRATPVPTQIRPMPREVPHLAYELRREYPGTRSLTTTIDPTTQRLGEEMVERHRANINSLGGEHASVVVVDHRSGELKAAVGNFDFFSPESGQAMAAFDVRRSTGSLLKPFLLAQAIDEGVAAPSHLVKDVPVDYGGYRPENFDGGHDGLVRLDDALARSLNIPFVELLKKVGVHEFLITLDKVGAPYPDVEPEHHGLHYVVGGIDASPMEVATMFSALARRGNSVPIERLSGGGFGVEPPPLPGALSAESTWLVRQIMQRRDRPDFPRRSLLRDRPSPYAWKTGTSMGFRDAWTAGFGPRYVVVVWTGNLDHRPGRRLVGQRAAAPLFFDLIEAIDPAGPRAYDTPPQGLSRVEVCSFSGHLPTAACSETSEVELPKRSVATEPCPYHVHVDVDVQTEEVVTPACRGDREVESRAYVRLPAEVRRFYDLRGGGDEIPPYAPECRIRMASSGPNVSSPPNNTVIALMSGVPRSAQRIPLEATVDGRSGLDWFVDGRFVGRVDNGDRLWWEPEPGIHEFVVTDDHGSAVRRVVEVR